MTIAYLLTKILLKFTPKLNKLYLTTLTLFKANFNKIYSKLHHLFIVSFPRLPSNGLATIALFLCNKWRFLEFSEVKIVSKYTSNCAIYQHFLRISMPSKSPPTRYMTTIYHYFCYFLGKIVTKHVRNSLNCGHTNKFPGSMLSNPPSNHGCPQKFS